MLWDMAAILWGVRTLSIRLSAQLDDLSTRQNACFETRNPFSPSCYIYEVFDGVVRSE
jgi:hypothetical protein